MKVTDLLLVPIVPSIVDSWMRLRFLISRRTVARSEAESVLLPHEWLVVVPARAEGEHVEGTLRSVRDASVSRIPLVVVLDGNDEATRRVATSLEAMVVVKEPSGPTKGAALAWMARNEASLLRERKAVLLLDVGSRLPPLFFDRFRWPAQAAAIQCFLSGRGSGVARGISQSEHFAQHLEDRGRMALGWSVRLRGTGCAFRPDVFEGLAIQLVTQVEDLEGSLLLAAAGETVLLGDEELAVIDEKPHSIEDAAMQRARWLFGTMEIFAKRKMDLARLFRRRPLEGIAFVAQMLARPLSLFLVLRICVAVVFLFAGGEFALSASLLIGLSILTDLACWIRVEGLPDTGSASLFVAWLRAIPAVPRATARWLRSKR